MNNDALEQQIVDNIWRFDPLSLIILLNHLDYKMEDILFCSHFSACSQSRLVESIEFRHAPKKAVVTLNLGLLGGQSVLPNYFFKQIDNEKVEEEQFAAFFGYFDDRILRRFLFAIYSELDQTFAQSWEERKRAEIYTLKLDNLNTLQWLAELVFPELQIRVKKIKLERSVILRPPILGKLNLGHQTVFGKKKNLLVVGKQITLIADEENFTNGKPWSQEINLRLENLIFPILKLVGIDLEIWLVIRSQSTSLSLKQDSYLGYENIRSNNLQVKRIRIFSGYLCD